MHREVKQQADELRTQITNGIQRTEVKDLTEKAACIAATGYIAEYYALMDELKEYTRINSLT